MNILVPAWRALPVVLFLVPAQAIHRVLEPSDDDHVYDGADSKKLYLITRSVNDNRFFYIYYIRFCPAVVPGITG
jgi:hypothetical protein